MENQIETLECDETEKNSDVEEQSIISVNKFIFLCIITLGLYPIWWFYKSWRFFQQKDQLDVMPAMRALFAIFFIISLFDRILKFAQQKGYKEAYPPVGLFLGFLVSNLFAQIPNPVWLISFFSFLFLIPPFKALNYARQNSPELMVLEQESFNGRQIALIVIGASVWILLLLGLSQQPY